MRLSEADGTNLPLDKFGFSVSEFGLSETDRTNLSPGKVCSNHLVLSVSKSNIVRRLFYRMAFLLVCLRSSLLNVL